jgi:hypothetical protein
MLRLFAIAAGVVAVFGASATAAAEPAEQDGSTYAIGKCYDPATPPVEKPESFEYNCDSTGVMKDLTWTAWGADGANATGTDSSVECRPNCAQGRTLVNPIVVHAWNPVVAPSATCPRDIKFYSDMTIAYPKGSPPWIKPGTTWSPGTDFVTIDGMPAVHYSDLTPTCKPL